MIRTGGLAVLAASRQSDLSTARAGYGAVNARGGYCGGFIITKTLVTPSAGGVDLFQLRLDLFQFGNGVGVGTIVVGGGRRRIGVAALIRTRQPHPTEAPRPRERPNLSNVSSRFLPKKTLWFPRSAWEPS